MQNKHIYIIYKNVSAGIYIYIKHTNKQACIYYIEFNLDENKKNINMAYAVDVFNSKTKKLLI